MDSQLSGVAHVYMQKVPGCEPGISRWVWKDSCLKVRQPNANLGNWRTKLAKDLTPFEAVSPSPINGKINSLS